uniref:Uncharacterized protein n=1 Tax=Sphaerodactylus townsendi TaxID=933632 RepID=A0ACB8FJ44_9SAUR
MYEDSGEVAFWQEDFVEDCPVLHEISRMEIKCFALLVCKCKEKSSFSQILFSTSIGLVNAKEVQASSGLDPGLDGCARIGRAPTL